MPSGCGKAKTLTYSAQTAMRDDVVSPSRERGLGHPARRESGESCDPMASAMGSLSR